MFQRDMPDQCKRISRLRSKSPAGSEDESNESGNNNNINSNSNTSDTLNDNTRSMLHAAFGQAKDAANYATSNSPVRSMWPSQRLMTLDRKVSEQRYDQMQSLDESLTALFRTAHLTKSDSQGSSPENKAMVPPEPTPFRFDRPVRQLAPKEPCVYMYLHLIVLDKVLHHYQLYLLIASLLYCIETGYVLRFVHWQYTHVIVQRWCETDSVRCPCSTADHSCGSIGGGGADGGYSSIQPDVLQWDM
jgi:hypothetical protein